jgi:hypothetical protein
MRQRLPTCLQHHDTPRALGKQNSPGDLGKTGKELRLPQHRRMVRLQADVPVRETGRVVRVIEFYLARLARLHRHRTVGPRSFLQSGTLRGSEKFSWFRASFLKMCVDPGTKKATELPRWLNLSQLSLSLLRHNCWGGWRWCCRRSNRQMSRSGRTATTAGRGGGCCTGIAGVQPGELGLQLVEQADFARIGTGRCKPREDRAADEGSATGLRFVNRGTGCNHWCGALTGTGRVAEVWFQTRQFCFNLRQQTQSRTARIAAGRHRLTGCEARRSNAGRAAASAVRAAHHDRGVSAKGHRRCQQKDRCIHGEISRVIDQGVWCRG